MKRLSAVLTVLMLILLPWAAVAQANGTLTARFIYNGGGSDQPLANAYAYLKNSSAKPRGRYYQMAQYMLGPTDANGNLSVSAPAGTYFVRLTRRAPLTAAPASGQMYGPPRPGDYTWGGTHSLITITDGSVVSLGTVYANIAGSAPFGAPITITGRVTKGGVAQAGYFVYASQSLCAFGWQNGCQGGIDADTNGTVSHWCQSSVVPSGCPGTKYLAQSRTDSNGNYTIIAGSPGTYYVFAQPFPGCQSNYDYHAYDSNWYYVSFYTTATAWDPAPSCAACICGGQYYASCPDTFGPSQGSAPLCYSDCPVNVTGAGANVNIAW